MDRRLFRKPLLILGALTLSLAAFGGDLKIHVINVGWGESVLVEGPSGVTVLFDTGKADKTTARVIPYLQSHISKLDYFVLGHNHDDHGGGAAALVNAFPPEHSYYNGSTINKGAAFMQNWFAAYSGIGKPSPLGMSPGTTIDLGDGATITCVLSDGKVLNQAAVIAKLQEGNPTYTLPVPTEANATSMALLVKYKGFDYLYTGDLDGQGNMDLETPAITAILLSDLPNVHTPEKGIDVLQVGHHGSKTATNARFVDLCGPKLAVVSVGPNQSFGLPNPEAVDDVLLAKGVKVLQTDEGKLGDTRMTRNGFVVGHVLISTDGSTYTVSADPSAIDRQTQPSVEDEGPQAGLPLTLNVDSMPLPPTDTQAPVVSAVSNGTSATIQFIADTTDNVGAVKADFLVDGKTVGSASGSAAQQVRFTLGFDSKTVANGNHSLVVKATDAAGNQGASPVVTFAVNNPPPAGTGFDEVEPNNTLATANAVASTVNLIKGYFPTATDSDDWYSLSLPAGRTLSIDMVGPTASGQNYNLYLCSATGTKLAKSEGTSTTEHLSYKNSATTAKTLYINVHRVTSSSRVTPYTLTLTR